MEEAKLPIFLAGFALFFLMESLAAKRPVAGPPRGTPAHARPDGGVQHHRAPTDRAGALPRAGRDYALPNRAGAWRRCWATAASAASSRPSSCWTCSITGGTASITASGLLWRFHKVHHVDTHVDVTTALRFHPGELFISFFVKLLWIAAWGPSLVGFAVFEICVSLASQFHHSNIDFPERWERRLRLFIVTPRFHTSHHTVSRRTGDANFATIFIVWDRLFGTYREPDPREMRELGLAEGRGDYLSFGTWLAEPFRHRNQNQAYRGQ
ncbi:MAG: sterol desaturase family protein [Anaerolineales bacterium]|nr:sterol desaturase family protein [Anaerolineales bacterium]